jgi:hypothetical protein
LPWNAVSDAKLEPKPAPKKRRDPLKLARYYQSLMDSGKFETKAALARYLSVSRSRVTQVLRRLNELPPKNTQGDRTRVEVFMRKESRPGSLESRDCSDSKP